MLSINIFLQIPGNREEAPRLAEFGSYFCHLFAVRLWRNYLIFLCLREFLVTLLIYSALFNLLNSLEDSVSKLST